MKVELENFFKVNQTPDVGQITIWKPIRLLLGVSGLRLGHIIKRPSCRKSELLQEIGILELQHNGGRELQRLQNRLAELNLENAKRGVDKCCQITYEFGNKPGRRLARILKSKQSISFISQIEKAAGGSAVTTEEIASEFRKFYEDLCNLPLTEPRQVEMST